jgi:CPA2 family monovalent cation:H+ antiporter-2
MVLVLVLLPSFGAGGADAAKGLAVTLGKVGVFVALMLLVGRKAFPRLLWSVAETGSRELFTLSVVGVAVGVAYFAAKLFGVSFALGAFFAGMVMRESALSHRAAEESLPMRDAFSVLFFVSVGMLFDPAVLITSPGRVAAAVAIIMLGKSLAAFLIVLAFRYPLNTALVVSASLAQIGEFSFILAGFAVSLDLMPKEAQSLILAGALISIALNHLVFRMIAPAEAWIRDRSTLARMLEQPNDPLAELPRSVQSSQVTGHILLVGYGRVGRRIAAALDEAGKRYVVAEENRELVEALRAKGRHAVAGDAAEPAVLIQAHVARASALVVAVPDAARSRRMVDIALALNPKVKILVRTHSDEERVLLEKGGVCSVFMGEQELASSMARAVLDAAA